MLEDTICAPATAPVNASLSIIRISGPLSRETAFSVFSRPGTIKDRHAAYGSIVYEGKVVDDVVLVYYQSPASFTGEEMVEIFCHGNPLIVSRIIRVLFKLGVRMAEPGEFSKRAFLNGKMDLTEAEAINTLINAGSDWEIDASIKQMHGSLKTAIDSLKDDLILLKADIEAGIDFTDQDIVFISYEQALEKLKSVRQGIESILRRCSVGARVSQGINVTLAGRPNVGKSSLLNLILNEERAIVSDIAGTTRDLIRETVQIGGVRINLTDTAGIGITGDEIERMGIERSRKSIAESSLVLVVIDAVAGITEEDSEIIEKTADKKRIFILNKKDLVSPDEIEKIENSSGFNFVHISAKSGDGFRELEERIAAVISAEFVDYDNSFIADQRILDILERSVETAVRVESIFKMDEPPEIAAFELNELIETLSGITGEISPDDILGSIFCRFCIGK